MIVELLPCSYEPNGEQGMVTIAINTSAAREVLITGLFPAMWSASMLIGADPPAVSGLLLHGGCDGGAVEQLQTLRSAGAPTMVRLGVLSRVR